MGNSYTTTQANSTPPLPSRIPAADQFASCIIGCCIGDSMGLLVEGGIAPDCKEFLEKELIPFVKDQTSGKTLLTKRSLDKGLAVGQYSDDSQLARELLQSYVNKATFDAHDYANRIGQIVKESRIVGCGKATAKAAAKINRGVPWDESGTKIGECGNGPAPRGAAIGLLYFDDEKKLLEYNVYQSKITHLDVRCAAGAVAIASAVSWCLTHQQFEINAFLTYIARLVRSVHTEFADYIEKLFKWSQEQPSKAAKSIAKLGMDFNDGSTGISAFMISSVVWSLYCFIRSPYHFLDAICIAISAGGDTDSTAAITGAISGAFLGTTGLPKQLVEIVNDKKEWKSADLQLLANECYKIKMAENT